MKIGKNPDTRKFRACIRDERLTLPELHLNLVAESQISGVSQTRDDISLCREFIINGGAPDLTGRYFPADIFDAHGTGNDRNNMDFRRMTLCPEILNGLNQGRSGCQHRIREDQDAVLQIRTGNVVEADLK